MHATTQKPDIDMCQGSVCCGEGTYLASGGLCLSKIKCGPGTKLDIDAGECIPTMEGLMEACFESRPQAGRSRDHGHLWPTTVRTAILFLAHFCFWDFEFSGEETNQQAAEKDY